MVYFLTFLATLFNVYCLYTVMLRMARIKALPSDIMPKKSKKEYMKLLESYLMIFIVSTMLSFLLISFKMLGLELLPPMVSIILSSNLLYKVIDEIEEFDISKNDSDIVKDFLDKAMKDSKVKRNKITPELMDSEARRELEARKRYEESSKKFVEKIDEIKEEDEEEKE